MGFDLKSISSGKRSLPPRIVLLGTPKVGKTTFACQAPNAIVLPIKGEEGVDDIEVAKFPTAERLEDVFQALTTLEEENHNYRFVVIDSASALERLVWEYTCRYNNWANIETPGWGKGYATAISAWVELINRLDVLRNNRGMGCILIGHVTVKTINDPMFEQPYDQWIWDLNAKATSTLLKWADCCLFARKKAIVMKKEGSNKVYGEDKRVLLTQERPSHPGGGRGIYGHLPYELPLEWNAWMEAITQNNTNN